MILRKVNQPIIKSERNDKRRWIVNYWLWSRAFEDCLFKEGFNPKINIEDGMCGWMKVCMCKWRREPRIEQNKKDWVWQEIRQSNLSNEGLNEDIRLRDQIKTLYIGDPKSPYRANWGSGTKSIFNWILNQGKSLN